jgi:endonuclease/exonuclease/phosphatase family metal-dependent hydrolase
VAKFRLIIWNVQDLLAVGAEGGARPQQGFDAKLAAPAAVVDAQQPDVLALQEVGEPEQLAALHQLFHTRHRFGRRHVVRPGVQAQRLVQLLRCAGSQLYSCDIVWCRASSLYGPRVRE